MVTGKNFGPKRHRCLAVYVLQFGNGTPIVFDLALWSLPCSCVACSYVGSVLSFMLLSVRVDLCLGCEGKCLLGIVVRIYWVNVSITNEVNKCVTAAAIGYYLS